MLLAGHLLFSTPSAGGPTLVTIVGEVVFSGPIDVEFVVTILDVEIT